MHCPANTATAAHSPLTRSYARNNPAKYAEFNQYKDDKNSFWPRLSELTNRWTLAVVGAGMSTLALQKAVEAMMS